jgi:hypothetical protein
MAANDNIIMKDEFEARQRIGFGQLNSDTSIVVAVITIVQYERSKRSPKQRLSVDVKLDDDGRVTVWDEEALNQADCQLIKGRLLGRRGDIVVSQRQDLDITLTGIACRKGMAIFGIGRS